MDAYPREAWLRLGQHLKQRRPQIDPRYRIRRVFAEENGLTDKTVQEIENAYRDTFSPVMLSTVEAAYRLKEGSIERCLGGGELAPQDPAVQVSQVGITVPQVSGPGVRVERYDDRHIHVDVTVDTQVTMEEAIKELERDRPLSPHERATVEMLRGMRYEPMEVAGFIMLLRGMEETRAADQETRRNA